MRPLGVVEVYPFCDDPHRCEAVGQLLQVDGLVFERPPQAFDKYVVHAAAPPIHGDCNARVLEDAGEVEAGELASLVGVEDIRAAAAIQGFSQRLDAEGGIMLFDGRQASTWRVAQSMIATRLSVVI